MVPRSNLCQSVRMADDGAKRLADAVKTRRQDQGWSQKDVTDRGGPSTETMRLIEGGRRDSYGSRTLLQLDRSLGWHDGTTRKVLDGTATETDLSTISLRSGVPRVAPYPRFRNIADSARGIHRPGDPAVQVEPGEEVEIAAVIVREESGAYVVQYDSEWQPRPLMKDAWLRVDDDYCQRTAAHAGTATGTGTVLAGVGTLTVGSPPDSDLATAAALVARLERRDRSEAEDAVFVAAKDWLTQLLSG